MPVLELKNVYKDYHLENKEVFTALQDINISFDKGELVSIIGESGSGKSTLMNLIGGLDSDYKGIINVSGQDLKSFKQKELDDHRKKKIGFVFQSFNLIPHLSVLDNVTIGLTLSNVKESVKNKKAIEILTKLGLHNQIKKKPTQLSGGQKQRVAIARALINDPDIILADEPTGSLDSTTTVQILDILKEIADDGKLVIMVTHSEKVASISSRIVEISDGKIVRDEKNQQYVKGVKNNRLVEEQSTPADKKEGHLTLFSAIKLSFHNMLASKTKNFLMSFGVSISLIAMIIMLSFGAGLTNYISSQAEAYTDPKVATISKKGSGSIMKAITFTEEEIDDVVIDLNKYLEDKTDFKVVSEKMATGKEPANLSYGFNIMTMGSTTVTYYLDDDEVLDPDSSEEEKKKEGNVFYLYTTPPYYTDKYLLTKNSRFSGDNEIMLTPAAQKIFGFETLEEIVGKKVTLNLNIPGYSIPPLEVTITGIVDASLFSGTTIMYLDYNYLKNLVATYSSENFGPSILYIQTGDSKITEMIDQFVSTRKDLAGSLEQKLVKMFNEMLHTFSLALAIIAGISLVVAAIMILVVLYMSVTERTREIGILKSIGARKKDIKCIFTTESFLIGVLSGIIGIIFTLIIGAILIAILNSILGFAPIKMMWYYFLEAMFISIFISVIAGLYPSAKAARLDPVESLRHE